MTDTPTPPPSPDDGAGPDEQARPARAWLTEALVVFAISAALTRALSDLAGLSALVGEYLFTLVAAVFLGLPYFLLTRKKRSFEAHAMTWDGWQRGLKLALVFTALTALPFFGGYHLWRTQVLGHRFEFSLDHYRQLPAVLEGAPPQGAKIEKPEVRVWRDGRLLFVQWGGGAEVWERHRVEVALRSPGGGLWVEAGRRWVQEDPARRGDQAVEQVTLRSSTEGQQLQRATLRQEGGEALEVEVKLDGEPATDKALKLGPALLPPDEVGAWRAPGVLSIGRGLGWLPLLVLAQLLLVALPEEYFYRGYLQTTLARVWPKRAKLWIFEVGPAILVTSLLFGLGHVVIDIRPARMSVFFPSLLFGWMRDRTGTLATGIFYHAACNLLVEAATCHYF